MTKGRLPLVWNRSRLPACRPLLDAWSDDHSGRKTDGEGASGRAAQPKKGRRTRPDSISRFGRKRRAAGFVASDASRTVEDRQAFVGLLQDPHVDPGVVMAMPILRNLATAQVIPSIRA